MEEQLLDKTYVADFMRLRYEPLFDAYIAIYPHERRELRVLNTASAEFLLLVSNGLPPREACRRLHARHPSLCMEELLANASRLVSHLLQLRALKSGSVEDRTDSLVCARELDATTPAPGRAWRPWRVQVAINEDCDLRCRHCYTRSAAHSMALSDFRRLLAALSELGIMQIELVGGEPSLHPEFQQIVYDCIQARMAVRIFTNGQSLTSQVIQFVAPLAQFNVALHGEPAYHDDFVGKPGAAERLLQTAAALRDAGGEVSLLAAVNTLNIGQLDYLAAQSRRLQVRFNPLPVIPSGRALREFDFDPIDYMRVASRLARFRRRAGDPSLRGVTGVRLPRDLICQGGRSFFYVSARLEVYPCPLFVTPEFRAGHALNDDLSELWLKAPVFAAFSSGGPSNVEPCDSCTDSYCLYWCKATLYHFTGSLKEAPPYCPRVAALSKRSNKSRGL